MYKYMGTEHNQDQQNHGEISPGKLRHGGMCNPIGEDIFTMRQEEFGRRVCRRGEASSGKLFASNFLWKIKISHNPHRNSRYNVGQEIRPRPPESRDVRGQKI